MYRTKRVLLGPNVENDTVLIIITEEIESFRRVEPAIYYTSRMNIRRKVFDGMLDTTSGYSKGRHGFESEIPLWRQRSPKEERIIRNSKRSQLVKGQSYLIKRQKVGGERDIEVCQEDGESVDVEKVGLKYFCGSNYRTLFINKFIHKQLIYTLTYLFPCSYSESSTYFYNKSELRLTKTNLIF